MRVNFRKFDKKPLNHKTFFHLSSFQTTVTLKASWHSKSRLGIKHINTNFNYCPSFFKALNDFSRTAEHDSVKLFLLLVLVTVQPLFISNICIIVALKMLLILLAPGRGGDHVATASFLTAVSKPLKLLALWLFLTFYGLIETKIFKKFRVYVSPIGKSILPTCNLKNKVMLIKFEVAV